MAIPATTGSLGLEKMKTNIAQNVGVDICKATLDVHLHPAGIARQFANDAKGFKALLS